MFSGWVRTNPPVSWPPATAGAWSARHVTTSTVHPIVCEKCIEDLQCRAAIAAIAYPNYALQVGAMAIPLHRPRMEDCMRRLLMTCCVATTLSLTMPVLVGT